MVYLLCDLLNDIRPLDSVKKNLSLKNYRDLITFVKNRPGHDLRYAICADAIEKDLRWTPKYTFEKGLRETILWYLENSEWSEQIREEKYDGERLGA